MKELFSELLLPVPIIWILIIFGFIFFQLNKKVLLRINLFILTIWMIIISTPIVPDFLIKRLEYRYNTFTKFEQLENGKPVHILVLGSGNYENSNLPYINQLSEEGLLRLAEGIRIHNQLNKSLLITSGHKGRNNISNAKISALAAVSLGIISNNIKLLEEPQNTWMEAAEYKRIFGTETNLVLVTGANHMPRSMYLFQKKGLNPLPAPTAHKVKKRKNKNLRYWIPSAYHIKKMENVMHEYLGLLWHKLGGI